MSQWIRIGAGLCLWPCIWGLLGLARPAAAQISSDIVNGQLTWDWPAVASFDTGSGTCTATLIGCRTVLTAAHCICDPAGTGAACPDGTNLLDPSNYLVFFQHAGDQDPFSSVGQYRVSGVEIAPNYQFGTRSDLAVLELLFPVRGIAPAPINTLSSPPSSTGATIVGFGTTSDTLPDSGLKREGSATTGSCTGSGAPDAFHVCWTASPETTCFGDSGGPLLADVGAGTTVAGVHSGIDVTCSSATPAFDADVFVDHSWIETAAGADMTATSCGDGPQVGDVQVTVDTFTGIVSTSQNHQFSVAAGTKLLRVALNAELGSTPNDFDLLLRFNAPPTLGNNDCRPLLVGSFEYCEIADPTPGTWHLEVDVFAGGPGEYQVTATRFPENPAPPALGLGDLLVADFNAWELMQVEDSSGGRWIQSAQLRGSGPMLAAPEDVGIDANGEILVTNFADRSVFEIDEATGDRTLLSGCVDFPCSGTVGGGPAFLGPRFIGFEASNDLVISDRADPGIAAVVRVDRVSGQRSIVSGCDDAACTTETGTGPSFDSPFGISVDANGDIIVADSFAVLSVDPITGDRTVISGCNDLACSGTTGSGESFRQPRDLAIEFGGDFLVVDGDPVAPALFHVDAASGARTVLSGCADAACSGTLGVGPAFGAGLIGLEIGHGGTLVVTDSDQGTVFSVNRFSGDRAVVSGCVDAACSSAVGSGTHFTSPAGVALPEPGTTLGLLAGISLLAALRRRRRL